LAFRQVYISHILVKHVIEKFLLLHYTSPLAVKALKSRSSLSYVSYATTAVSSLERSLSLTTAKFKPLILFMSGFAFSYTTNTFILTILYDFCLSPAPHGKHRLLLSNSVLGVFTTPLYGNGHGADHIENNLSIFETYLPSRWLAIGIHVTILIKFLYT
jgi:hypothetical protein